MRSYRTLRLTAGLVTAAVGLATAGALAGPGVARAAGPGAPRAAGPAAAPTSLQISSTGLPDGAIKHVWLIILENKSYDATFTGLNKNSYLWQTLPQQGVLLKNYYGTGHYSQDNYESLVSGQAPQQDTQSDCDVAATNFGSNATIESNGPVASNVNLGQVDSPAGPNAPDGKNGCVYPSNTPTLFNQLDAAGKTWKGYAQDLGAQPGREDGACGYPGTATNTPDSATVNTVTPTQGPTQLNNPKAYPGVRSFGGVQAAGNDANGVAGAKEDGYVAKHFPFPWFHSLLDGTTTPAGGGTDCDAGHIANLDSQTQGLFHDLQSEATTPNVSWITPNNCSDAHDAVCKGNNLSGAFDLEGNPNYTSVTPAYDPQNTRPVNYTGGLYASDLFLKWYVPLIEQSPAFKDGGLIDVTFDEANPAFANSSFNNANDPAFAPGRTSPGVSDPATLASFLASDNAGQNVNGVDQPTEPAGPNTPLTYQADGLTPNPGPGDNGFIHRIPAGARTDAAANAGSGATTILDNSITAVDPGRSVTGTGIPANSFVGPVSDVGPVAVAQSVDATGASLSAAQASAVAGSFALVDANGNAVTTTAAVSGVTLGAQSGDPTAANYDPLYDARDFTPGGGDTGSVLISPYIKPGSTSTRFYNHYSWLRTMEDLFDVGGGAARAALTPGTGSVSGGVDGLGHLGFAAQPGLGVFGPDVFTNEPSAPVPPAPPVPVALTGVTLGGAGAVGRPEDCSPGMWTGAPGFAYQWYVSGAAIPLATQPLFTPVGAEVGRVLTCRVVATNSSGSGSALSFGLIIGVGGPVKVLHGAHLTGRLRVGSRVALTGLRTSPARTRLAYQWKRNGRAISHATGSSYRLTFADRGRSISCTITVSSTGYRSTTTTTAAHRVV